MMPKDYFGPLEEDEIIERIPAKSIYHDASGKQFGNWTVDKKVRGGYQCTCSCGTVRKVSYASLITSKSTRCLQCNRKEKRARRKEFRKLFG